VKDLEVRNRELNEKVSAVLYSKAEQFKATAINKLKQSCENVEPNLKAHRESEARFAHQLQAEQFTAKKSLLEMERAIRNNDHILGAESPYPQQSTSLVAHNLDKMD